AAEAEAAEQMERQVASLNNQALREGAWHAVFTSDQINGWLAATAPRVAPDLLPPGLHDPRVKIRPSGITIACQADWGRLQSVLSLDLDVYTDTAGILTLRFRQVRAGAVPWPMKPVLDGVSEACRHAGLRVDWEQAGGDPVARITLDHIEGRHGKFIQVQQVRLEEGAIHVSGVTGREKDKG
ncbi:MAG: hypothetical protein ABR915_18655, partial [Thermoguttaceae bacterium]